MRNDDIKPGVRVTPRTDIEGYKDLRAILAGHGGRVVRLVHITIEGEPFEDGRPGEQTIAHVRWDDVETERIEDIYPIDPACLRALSPGSQQLKSNAESLEPCSKGTPGCTSSHRFNDWCDA